MRSAAPALALLAAGFAATLWLGPWADERITDLFLYREFAEWVLGGSLPYLGFDFEYPPLAAGVVALPGLVGTDYESYRLAFACLALLLAAGLVLLCGSLAVRTGGDPRRAMLAAAATPLLIGAVIRTRFDLAPVVLTLGALGLLCSSRPRLGMAVLGLGVMTKGFPLVVAPPALAWLRGARGPHEALHGALALGAVVALVGAAALVVSPGGTLDAVRYQVERPVQLESGPATALLALHGIGAGRAEIAKSHGSDNLLHPAGDPVAALFALALLIVLGALTMAAARAGRELTGAALRRSLVLASLPAVLAFAVLGKVLSPQFLIWTAPLAALAFAWRLHALAGVLAVATALTLVAFPSRYLDLVEGEPLPLALTTVRNALLLVALGLALRELLPRLSRRGGATARSSSRARPPRPRPAQR